MKEYMKKVENLYHPSMIRLKKAYKIIIENITPDVLDYLPFDAFIITACPRIVYDDWKNYKKPVLLPNEYEELKKIKKED